MSDVTRVVGDETPITAIAGVEWAGQTEYGEVTLLPEARVSEVPPRRGNGLAERETSCAAVAKGGQNGGETETSDPTSDTAETLVYRPERSSLEDAPKSQAERRGRSGGANLRSSLLPDRLRTLCELLFRPTVNSRKSESLRRGWRFAQHPVVLGAALGLLIAGAVILVTRVMEVVFAEEATPLVKRQVAASEERVTRNVVHAIAPGPSGLSFVVRVRVQTASGRAIPDTTVWMDEREVKSSSEGWAEFSGTLPQALHKEVSVRAICPSGSVAHEVERKVRLGGGGLVSGSEKVSRDVLWTCQVTSVEVAFDLEVEGGNAQFSLLDRELGKTQNGRLLVRAQAPANSELILTAVPLQEGAFGALRVEGATLRIETQDVPLAVAHRVRLIWPRAKKAKAPTQHVPYRL